MRCALAGADLFAGGAYFALYVCARDHRVADMKSNVGATRELC